MKTKQARTSRAKSSVRSRSDWGGADNAALVAGLVAQNTFAQLEFIRRFGDVIEERVAATVRRFSDALRTPEMIEELVQAVACTMTMDRAMMRSFDPERGVLADWVARVAKQVTLRHMDELTSDPLHAE